MNTKHLVSCFKLRQSEMMLPILDCLYHERLFDNLNDAIIAIPECTGIFLLTVNSGRFLVVQDSKVVANNDL